MRIRFLRAVQVKNQGDGAVWQLEMNNNIWCRNGCDTKPHPVPSDNDSNTD